MLKLIVEGWRSSFHSYALVNQRQLLQLLTDARFDLRHRDVPFCHPDWAALDSGLEPEEKARINAIPSAGRNDRADIIYRISYPIRAHEGAGRVFVFATSECNPPHTLGLVGEDGLPESACPEAVDFITSSAWSRAGYLAAGLAPERVHVVPHGVDPAFARQCLAANREEARQELSIPADAFVFLNIGAMTWNKGIAPLLAAFAVHRRSHPRSMLVLKASEALYGNCMQAALNEAMRLRPECRDADFAQAIRYVPLNLSLSRLAALYGVADAYVSPYRAEGFNLPVLEAMAAGLPVLVTAGGPTDDFCPSGLSYRISADVVNAPEGYGYLEPRIESIVTEMERVTGDPAARVRIARGASDWALERYSWANATNRLAEIMQR